MTSWYFSVCWDFLECIIFLSIIVELDAGPRLRLQAGWGVNPMADSGSGSAEGPRDAAPPGWAWLRSHRGVCPG